MTGVQTCALPISLEISRGRLGTDAAKVKWMRADVRRAQLDEGAYAVWHDRAVFHFLTQHDQRVAYVQQVTRAMKPGGTVIVATFGPEGPETCSGLATVRYDADALHDQFGTRFQLVESATEMHRTPFGTTQQFLYCYCKIK